MRLITIISIVSLLMVSYMPLVSLGGTEAPFFASRSTLIDHDPIIIQSDSGFNASNGVVSGNGSVFNPFIIENWSIDASHQDGIEILNTNSHFIIRNCSIWTPRWYSNHGVYFDSTSNGSLINLNLSYNNQGIEFQNSHDIHAQNVTFYKNSKTGIWLEDSNNITFRNFSINQFSFYGINIENGNDLLFENFSIENQGEINLNIETSQRARFSNGWINGSEYYGIFISGSEGLVLSNISVTNNTEYGIRINDLSNGTIQDCHISNSGDDGFYLDGPIDKVRFINNELHDNYIGIDIQETSNSYFLGNNAHDNEFAGMIISSGSKNDTFFENKIAYNRYNFGIDNWRVNPTYLGLRIASNNTIEGKPIYFWSGVSHQTVPSDAGYVGLVHCDNITVQGLSFTQLFQSVFMNSSRDITVRDCIFTNNYDAMDIQNSTMKIFNNSINGGEDQFGLILEHMARSVINNNTFNNLSFGLQISDSQDMVIRDNSFFNLTHVFYRGWYSIAVSIISSKTVSIYNNTILNSFQYAIKISQSKSAHVLNNKIDKCKYAISFTGSIDSSIDGNDVDYCYSATSFSKTTNSSILGNEIEFCTYAIEIYSSNPNIERNNISNGNYGLIIDAKSYVYRVRDNGMRNTTYGIISSNFLRSDIINNTFYENRRAITLSSGCNKNTFANNLFINNTYGVYIGDTSTVKNNLFYNNFFNDTTDVNTGLYGNTWNISKRPGRSIVGGLFLGGNYWSNYSGQDLDGDYIGDTLVPYGHKDYHPLIIAPAILDLTNSTPVTGSPFDFKASLWFPVGQAGFKVEYWFDNGSHNQTPMVLMDGKATDGNYSLTIVIPMDAGMLHYFFQATSAKGEKVVTNVTDLSVKDIFAPTIEYSGVIPTTGDNYTLGLDIQDNRGFSNKTVDLWFDNGNRTRLESLNITKTLIIPLSAHEMHFIANATDLSNNTASLEETVPVLDNKPPSIVMISGRPGTGAQYRFRCNVTDNWEVINVSMDFWFDGARSHPALIFTSGIYWADILIPLNSTMFHYSIRALDSSSNIIWSNGSQAVRDIIPPAITDRSGVPSTGDIFEVKAEFSDMIDKEITNKILDYSFDSGPPMRVNFPGSFKVQVPDGARQMNYTIRCVDQGGNPMSLGRNVAVADNDPPSLVDHTRGRPTSGRSYLLNVSVHDNIGIKDVYAEYWFEGQKKRVDMFEQNGYFLGIIDVPDGAEKLHYILLAEDTTGNKASLPQKTLGLSTETNYTNTCIMIGLVLVAVAVLFVVVTYSYQRHKTEKIPKEPPSDDEVMEMDDGAAEEE